MKKLLTVPDLMEIFGVKKSTACKIMGCKTFPSFKVGGRWYVDPDDFQDWITANRHKQVFLQ